MKPWERGELSKEREPVEWTDLVAAQVEVKKILDEIGQTLVSGEGRTETGRRTMGTYVLRLEEAFEKERQALDAWLAFVRRNVRED